MRAELPRRRLLRPRTLAAYLLALLTVAPLVLVVIAVFKPEEDTFQAGLPADPTLDNLNYALTEVPLPRFLFNSALVAIVVTVVALLFHTMAAYALARLRFPGRQVIFSLIVSTLLVSLPVIVIPLFIVIKELGLLDSYAGLIVPSIFHAFGIFLLRQYYLNIPKELEEAAQLDGCGYPRLYWHVILPLSRPMLAALAVLFFLANWNAFLWPLAITQNPDLRVVQLGLAGLRGQYSAAWNIVLAGSLIASIPTVLVFLAGQRWLVNALKTSGIK